MWLRGDYYLWRLLILNILRKARPRSRSQTWTRLPALPRRDCQAGDSHCGYVSGWVLLYWRGWGHWGQPLPGAGWLPPSPQRGGVPRPSTTHSLSSWLGGLAVAGKPAGLQWHV